MSNEAAARMCTRLKRRNRLACGYYVPVDEGLVCIRCIPNEYGFRSIRGKTGWFVSLRNSSFSRLWVGNACFSDHFVRSLWFILQLQIELEELEGVKDYGLGDLFIR